ncbi:epoxide hydrolase 2-like [Rutidosis leptorrhynchoides]|uniref:epoxide hydrolase 2-like n=1 Tax=Rutidosis leptorrhynchoides TaxID=125765 RepID=UPI003A98E0D9
MHIAELGKGPTVILIHGFPELWFTWRHQIVYLASHGYRAIAPDLRGFGDTTGAPTDDVTKFTTLHVVGDLVALIDIVVAPGEDKVFVVARDWGLGAHRRNPIFQPVDALRALYGNDFYMVRFQKRGRFSKKNALNREYKRTRENGEAHT